MLQCYNIFSPQRKTNYFADHGDYAAALERRIWPLMIIVTCFVSPITHLLIMQWTSHPSQFAAVDSIFLEILLLPDQAEAISIFVLQFSIPLIVSIIFSLMTICKLQEVLRPISIVTSKDEGKESSSHSMQNYYNETRCRNIKNMSYSGLGYELYFWVKIEPK